MAGLAAGWLAGAHHVVRALLDDDEAAVHNYHRQTCSELDWQRFGVGEAQLGLKNRAQLTVPHNRTRTLNQDAKNFESRGNLRSMGLRELPLVLLRLPPKVVLLPAS